MVKIIRFTLFTNTKQMNISVVHTLISTLPNHGLCIPKGMSRYILKSSSYMKEYNSLMEYMKYYKYAAPSVKQVKTMDNHMKSSICYLVTTSGDSHYKIQKEYMNGPIFQVGDDMLNFTEVDYQIVDAPTCNDFCQTPSRQRIYYNWHLMDRTMFNHITCIYGGNALMRLKNTILSNAQFYGHEIYNPSPIIEAVYILLDKCNTVHLYGLTEISSPHEYGLLRSLISDGKLYVI